MRADLLKSFAGAYLVICVKNWSSNWLPKKKKKCFLIFSILFLGTTLPSDWVTRRVAFQKSKNTSEFPMNVY
jgi:hypothetical protein